MASLVIQRLRSFAFFALRRSFVAIAQLLRGVSLINLPWRRCTPAMRQTWEEIGLDLAEPEYTCIGQLDDREITTSLGKRLLMILSPFGELLLSSFLSLEEPFFP